LIEKIVIDKFNDIINKASNILVFAHKRPDGDAIGSIIALSLYLELIGKNATMYIPDDIPAEYDFLVGYNKITNNSDGKYDLFVSLDQSDISRTYGLPLYITKELMINIDHHKSNTYFGSFNIVMPDYSSTCEILTELIGDKGNIDIYNALYTGILTDTGSFKYANTNRTTFKNAIYLIDCGVEPAYISQNVFMRMKKKKLKLLALTLNTLEFYDDKAFMYINQNMLKETGANMSDTESITGYTLITRGTEMGIFLREESASKTRVSFRSKNKYDVDIIAKEFGGGGHKNAAGCNIDMNLKDTIKLIKKEVLEYE